MLPLFLFADTDRMGQADIGTIVATLVKIVDSRKVILKINVVKVLFLINVNQV